MAAVSTTLAGALHYYLSGLPLDVCGYIYIYIPPTCTHKASVSTTADK